MQNNIFYYGISTGGIVALSAGLADNEDWNPKLEEHYGEVDVHDFGYYQELKDEISTAGIISFAGGIPELDWISEEEGRNTPLFLLHGTNDFVSPYIKGNGDRRI